MQQLLHPPRRHRLRRLRALQGGAEGPGRGRTDACTGRRFAFFADPDGLPLELCEDGPR